MTILWSDGADFSFSVNKVATPTLIDVPLLTIPPALVDDPQKGILLFAIGGAARPGTVYSGTTIDASVRGQLSLGYLPTVAPTVTPIRVGRPLWVSYHAAGGGTIDSILYGGIAMLGAFGATGFDPLPGLPPGGTLNLSGCFNDTIEYFDGTIVACVDDMDDKLPDPFYGVFKGSVAGFDSDSVPSGLESTGATFMWAPFGTRSGTADTLGTIPAPDTWGDGIRLFGASGGASATASPTAPSFTGASNWTNIIRRALAAPSPCFSGGAGVGNPGVNSGTVHHAVPVGSLPSGASSLIVDGFLISNSGIYATAPVVTGTLYAVDSSGAQITPVFQSKSTAADNTFTPAAYNLPAGTAGIDALVTVSPGSGVLEFDGGCVWSIKLHCDQDSPYSYAASLAVYTGPLPAGDTAYAVSNPTPSVSAFGHTGLWEIGTMYGWEAPTPVFHGANFVAIVG